ncbi:MAG: NUDIX domain-containing protein [Candidatus Dojkabacteria bacterium]
MSEQLPSILIILRAVIINGPRILLIKRADSDSYEPGLWELPGGKLSTEKDVSNALDDEIMEETGLNIVPISRLVYCDSGIVNDYKKYKGHTYVRLVSLAKSDRDNVRLSSEHSEYKWVTFPEIFKMKEISPFTKKALLVLEQRIKACFWKM